VLVADSVAKVPDVVFTLGDNVYESGTAPNSPGASRRAGAIQRSIMKNVRPAPGNHDTEAGCRTVLRVLRRGGGKAGEGYYSYKAGEWHVVVLNSEIIVNPAFSGAARSAQMARLEKDLFSEHGALHGGLLAQSEIQFGVAWRQSQADTGLGGD
jgi:hypothetical protein